MQEAENWRSPPYRHAGEKLVYATDLAIRNHRTALTDLAHKADFFSAKLLFSNRYRAGQQTGHLTARPAARSQLAPKLNKWCVSFLQALRNKA